MISSNQTNCPILLTATIRIHDGQIGLHASSEERALQYESVLRWLVRERPGAGVVFCENSGCDLGSLRHIQEAFTEVGGSLELISRDVPAGTLMPGKGWGEGWTVRQALSKSDVLSRARAFIKLTGRYRYPNLNRFVSAVQREVSEHPETQFVCQKHYTGRDGRPYAPTHLFWSTREFYERHLIDAYEQVDDSAGTYLEHVFGERLLRAAPSDRIALLPFEVIVEGCSGLTGRPIFSRREIRHKKIRNLLCRTNPLDVLQSAERSADAATG